MSRTTPRSGFERADRSQLYVSRLVPLPFPLVVRAAVEQSHDQPAWRALPSGGVRVDDAWHGTAYLIGTPGTRTAAFRTHGALHHGRRTVSRIEIEVLPWASGTTEVALRPAVAAPYRWANRRLVRYFALAHEAADDLRRSLASRAGALALGDDGDPNSLTRPTRLAG